MITHVTEKETQLAHMLAQVTETLTRTTKERDALKSLVVAIHKARGRLSLPDRHGDAV